MNDLKKSYAVNVSDIELQLDSDDPGVLADRILGDAVLVSVEEPECVWKTIYSDGE